MYTYLARFEQKNWAGVVKLVVGYAGPCLRGKLSVHNDLDYLARNLHIRSITLTNGN